jgi:hypothetical protein
MLCTVKQPGQQILSGMGGIYSPAYSHASFKCHPFNVLQVNHYSVLHGRDAMWPVCMLSPLRGCAERAAIILLAQRANGISGVCTEYNVGATSYLPASLPRCWVTSPSTPAVTGGQLKVS